MSDDDERQAVVVILIECPQCGRQRVPVSIELLSWLFNQPFPCPICFEDSATRIRGQVMPEWAH